MRRQNMKILRFNISDPIVQLIASFALAFVLYAASFLKFDELTSVQLQLFSHQCLH